MATEINYIGHSAFFIERENCGILIDPFISGNPLAKFETNERNITDIFVTHGHADHLGDAISISKSKQTPITAVFELANYCSEKGASVNSINLGAKLSYTWGNARFLPAFHSSSTPDGKYAGMPASILFDINGKKIYHAGDTSLNSEMKVIGEVYAPEIALLPVGSTYTMDIDEAVIAAKWLKTSKVIPMHYNTFDAIKVNIEEFKQKLSAQGIECIILKPGESIKL